MSLSSEDCGGWRCYRPADLPAALTTRRGKSDFCDIDVVSSISDSRLVSDKPFVIRGGSTLHAATWRKQVVVAAARQQQLSVSIGYSWEIVLGVGQRDMLLHDYIEKRMHEVAYDGRSRLEAQYVFQNADPVLHSLPDAGRFTFPRLFEQWGWHAGSTKPLFALGGAESGVIFHKHFAAFETMPYGRKRWLLYPKGVTPPGASRAGWSITDWLNFVHPHLEGERAPIECIIRDGDVVFVPDDWYHAVVNLADSVALTHQYNQGYAFAALTNTLELKPLDMNIRMDSALANKDATYAVALLQEIMMQDPFNTECAFHLSSMLSEQLSRESGTPEFLKEALRIMVPYLHANSRNLAANQMLAKYYKLIGLHDKEIEHLERNAELQALGLGILRHAQYIEPGAMLIQNQENYSLRAIEARRDAGRQHHATSEL